MKFSEELNPAQYRIQAYSTNWVQVNDERLTQSCLITPNTLVPDWPVPDFSALTPAHIQDLAAWPVEIWLFGTGSTQGWLSPAIQQAAIAAQLSFECMNTPAACRTYNVILAEGRAVGCALFF